MNSSLLKEYAKDIGISLDEEKASLMTTYGEKILIKNKDINLTSIVDEDEFIVKHLLDSLTVASLEEVKGKVADIGTGGGFPGVILKIYKPEINVILVDSVNKKLKVVDEICKELGINVKTVHSRAEELANGDNRESFDCVVARAVAPLPKLLEFCLPLVKLKGHFIAMKGPDVSQEISKASKIEKILGGRIKKVATPLLPNNLNHTIIIYEKMKHTPKEFPRNLKKIENEPII